MIVVVDKLSRLPNYALAQDSIECYCKHFEYPLIRVFADQEKEWAEQCPMEDVSYYSFVNMKGIILVHVPKTLYR